MRVLVIGGGGREHALCWALKRSPEVSWLGCAPGNAGIAQVARCLPASLADAGALADLADAERADLVVVGPEQPLVAGLADLLRARRRLVFGCSQAAAELEGSKAFAKVFMTRHAIPTAAFGVFDEGAAAERFIDAYFGRASAPLVVKADGLAAGKGVRICADRAEARRAVVWLLEERGLGLAGRRLVLEEFLEGREASLMALVAGEQVAPLEPAEDHKAVFDGDRGPMTGGMGAISPTPALDAAAAARAVREVLEPAARGLQAEGRPFYGLMYAGLMVTPSGPKVLEFNCRFGDPEAQPLLLRLDEDLAPLLHQIARGRAPERVRFRERSAACVVVASAGYPGEYSSGQPISGLEQAAELPEVVIFHAGTRRAGPEVVTAGGRVLGVTALGDSLEAARARAYQAVERIHFPGAHYRRDIGKRGSA